ETKKSDSGGYFFVSQLHHVYVGLLVYTLLMTGMFLSRASNYIPAGISIVALIYAVVSYRAFMNDFEWESLPWEEIAPDAEGNDYVPEDSGETYVQPELAKDLAEVLSGGRAE
ncbi:RSN1, partial [Symbiodinium pilosum]